MAMAIMCAYDSRGLAVGSVGHSTSGASCGNSVAEPESEGDSGVFLPDSPAVPLEKSPCASLSLRASDSIDADADADDKSSDDDEDTAAAPCPFDSDGADADRSDPPSIPLLLLPCPPPEWRPEGGAARCITVARSRVGPLDHQPDRMEKESRVRACGQAR